MPVRTSAGKDYFTLLFEQHHRALYAYAYKKTRDSFVAEEIVQTAFIKFWKHQTKVNTLPQDNPERLLFFIAKALLVDFYRKKATTVSITEALASTEHLADNTFAERQEILHFNSLVRSAAGILPGRQKQVFEMSYFRDLSHEEIAMELNISRQTVKNLLTKAMRQVRKLAARQFMTAFISLL